LTADVHVTGARSMFDKMDTDHDGYLTKAEVKAGQEKVHAQGVGRAPGGLSGIARATRGASPGHRSTNRIFG